MKRIKLVHIIKYSVDWLKMPQALSPHACTYLYIKYKKKCFIFNFKYNIIGSKYTHYV